MAKSDIVDHGFKKLEKQLKKMSKMSVKTGILSDAGNHENGMTIAEIAAINEFGTEKRNADGEQFIHERPAHRDTFQKSRPKLKTNLAKSVDLVIEGKATPDQVLKRIGEWYVGQLKKNIIAWDDPENKPSTVKQKGFNNPLIHTGRTVNSINYEIE